MNLPKTCMDLSPLPLTVCGVTKCAGRDLVHDIIKLVGGLAAVLNLQVSLFASYASIFFLINPSFFYILYYGSCSFVILVFYRIVE